MANHETLTGTALHEAFHYIQASDPGAVGAGKYWLDTTSEPYILKRRNVGNSDWVTIGSAGDLSAYVAKALFDANTILAANSDNTPAALTVAEATMVGRQTGGNIDDIAQVSAGEKTAGTETALRAFSPDDIKDMIDTHGGSATSDYIHIEDQKAQNTAGGGFTSGAWRVRNLAEISDAGGHASVASDQITLAAGTYVFSGSAPGLRCANHQVRLANVTDSIYYYGSSEYADTGVDGDQTRSFVRGKFTIAGPKVFELQHQCLTTKATDGLGQASNFGTEVYASIEFWKVA